jgi:hypothetical protein
MKDQQTINFETQERKSQPQLSEVDQAVIDAGDHGDEFESMRQWQIDREIGVISGQS